MGKLPDESPCQAWRDSQKDAEACDPVQGTTDSSAEPTRKKGDWCQCGYGCLDCTYDEVAETKCGRCCCIRACLRRAPRDGKVGGEADDSKCAAFQVLMVLPLSIMVFVVLGASIYAAVTKL
eukprot:gnl/MRDRNA2_/MRDRNA2_25416_c0_seq1.p1 gnl/MRDRNA2_/MRDRNA2_25416_c0~~gnl/MRDRNA2_/MRDRNA2_25416_c0_seq1.p1  ORF type:complete len:122 (-),score=25.35 gnl/MRDRNA2_/MRDRNA2_25416_c0_seq1:47-412(-)